MKNLILLLTLITIVIISGCTIPGTGIEIPFIPDIFGPATVEYENDVVIIRSLTAIPSTILPGQETHLVAYIQNLGSKTLPLDDGEPITIELYDYCEGLFPKENIKVKCPGEKESDLGVLECKIDKLLPQETKEIRWALKPKSDIKLKTTCPLDGMKIYVRYPYRTSGLTTISFIDQREMQRQLEQGTFEKKTSYIVAGEGPVKAYITVEDQQPISTYTGATTVIALQIENKGSGFVYPVEVDGKNVHIKAEDIDINLQDLAHATDADCSFNKIGSIYHPEHDIRLIQDESSKLLCKIKAPSNVATETTKTVTVDIKYLYEFRKSVKVTVEPRLV